MSKSKLFNSAGGAFVSKSIVGEFKLTDTEKEAIESNSELRVLELFVELESPHALV